MEESKTKKTTKPTYGYVGTEVWIEQARQPKGFDMVSWNISSILNDGLIQDASL